MTSLKLLQDLEDLGVRVAVRGDNIHLRGPKHANTPALRERVRAHKAELLSLLASQSLSALLAMPLDKFSQHGQILEISVPWWDETLFFVPLFKDAETLRREGIVAHRIWTARELGFLLSVSNVTPKELRMLMVVRREFGGEVAELRPRECGGEPEL
jgi:hypothetical protein